MSKLVLNALPFNAVNLERALVDYAASALLAPFDLAAVPLEKIAPRAVLSISDVADDRKSTRLGKECILLSPSSNSTGCSSIPCRCLG